VSWSRREVLGALGGGAAATILWGCGGGRARVVSAGNEEEAGLRHWLRDAVARLAGGFASASALAAIRAHTVATADAGGRSIRGERVQSLVLAARDAAGRRFERVIADLSATAIDAAVDAMLAGRAVAPWRGSFKAPSDAPFGGDDPARARDDEWTGRAGELYARAEAAGSSRVVYRAGYVEVDDASIWFAGSDGADRFQRLVRGRAGAIFVAWSGSRPSSGVAESAGAMGPAASNAVGDADIDAAAARALELMTPGAAPDGDFAIVIDPSVAAATAEAGVADVMTAEAWRRADLGARASWRAAETLTIADDPSAASYGGYAFADDGSIAARSVLVDRGAPGAPLAAARRAGFAGPARAGAAHVVIDPGDKSLEELQKLVGSGLLVEDAGVARVDPIAWEIVVPIGRARRLDGGKRTGHVFADLELRATVPALLGGVIGVGAEARAFARRIELEGEPTWRSSSAPHLATRARIAPRSRRSA